MELETLAEHRSRRKNQTYLNLLVLHRSIPEVDGILKNKSQVYQDRFGKRTIAARKRETVVGGEKRQDFKRRKTLSGELKRRIKGNNTNTGEGYEW